MNAYDLSQLIQSASNGDLNAAHIVEGVINQLGISTNYVKHLNTIVSHHIDYGNLLDYDERVAGIINQYSIDPIALYALVHATAAQRAQAAKETLDERE